MTSRSRIPAVLAALVAVALATAAPAAADEAYDKVAAVYAQLGGQLDPCLFTQAELEAGLRGIPPAIRDVVPDLRRALEDGIAAHQRGDCKGRRPTEEGAIGGAGVPPATATPTVPTIPTTPAAAPPPTATAPAATTPPTTAPAPAPSSTTPTPAQQPAAASDGDATPLLVALIAVGALVLLALLMWGWARLRGWDPRWVARTRHAWGEAGFRTTSTWSEFTDWLRLGR